MARRFIDIRVVRILLLSASVPMSQVLAQGAATAAPASGAKKPITIDDYSRWRNIEGAELSPDGKWVAYALRYGNTLPAESKPSVRILNLDTNKEIEVPNAHSPSFSADSRWIAYQLDSVPARGGRGGASAAPPADTTAPAAQAPAVPGATTPSQSGGRGGAGATSVPPRVELRELATGRTQSWQRMQTGDFNSTATHLVM